MHRRDLLKGALASLAVGACGARAEPPCMPSPAPAPTPAPSPAARVASRPAPLAPGQRIRVLCIGAHPDDPESGCGGTLARYVEAGHDAHILYLTKGEGGIVGKTLEEAGAIRAAEALEGSRALGAKAHFFGKVSGAMKHDAATVAELVAVIDEIDPDVIFGHWPLDTNAEHAIAAGLTLQAYLVKPRRHPLYFFEVETGAQTLGFSPHVYVEIGTVLPKKLEAIRAHKSQDAERRLYERHHEAMERFRARESGGTAAEAFAVFSPDVSMGSVPAL